MFYLIIVSIIWSFTFGLIKHKLAGLDPNFISFLRMLFALPIFLPFLNFSKLDLKKILSFTVLGIIQYGIMYLTLIKSLFYIDAHLVVLFTAITPIYITLISALDQRRISLISITTSVIAFLAVVLIYVDYLRKNEILLKGLILTQIGNFCFAFGQVAYKRLLQNSPSVKDQDVFALMIFGAIIATSVATTISNGWDFMAQISLRQFGVILYLGIISTGLCLFLWNKGSRMVNNGTLAIMNNLKISLGFLVSIFIFQEKADLIKVILSLIIILISVFIQEKSQRHNIIIDKRDPVKT